MPTPERFAGYFNDVQTNQLLLAINPRRLKTANGHTHVPGHEVIAHLIRIFGFGNFTFELVEQPTLLFETVRPFGPDETAEVGSANRKRTVSMAEAPWLWRYDVAYRATMRLTVFDEYHNVACFYEDSSTGDASNQTRADAHDLALKSAITLAKKRCAVHLGDQFGLSLYNKGQRPAMVIRAMVASKKLLDTWRERSEAANGVDTSASVGDVSEGVSEQRSLGIDEKAGQDEVEASPEQQEQLQRSVGARNHAEQTREGDLSRQGEDATRPMFQPGHPQDEPHDPTQETK